MSPFPEWLRTGRLPTVTWKNGLGTTCEIAADRSGMQGDAFRWRASIATMNAESPFSLFPGIDRVLCVLEGEVLVSMPGKGMLQLNPASAPIAFAGEVAVSARPLDGPVQVLNLMMDRKLLSGTLEETRRTVLDARSRPLVLARVETTLASGSRDATLEARDALLMKEGVSGPLVFNHPVVGVRLETH